jgi:hypothetical protein
MAKKPVRKPAKDAGGNGKSKTPTSSADAGGKGRVKQKA